MKYLKELVQRFIRSRRAQVLAAMAVILVVGLFGAPWFMSISGNASVEKIVREMNFRPTNPPKSPEYPGTLYLVNSFGKMKSIVCESGMSSGSLTPKELESRIILNAANVKSGNPTGSGGSDFKVSISFKDSKLFEHDAARLNQIATQLQGQKLCREALEKYLVQGRCVVQSQSILVSTVEIVESNSGKVIVGTDRRKLVNLPNIEGALGKSKLLVGEKLQYGLRLRDRCLTTADIKYPRFVPDESWWIIKTSWNFVLSVWERII